MSTIEFRVGAGDHGVCVDARIDGVSVRDLAARASGGRRAGGLAPIEAVELRPVWLTYDPADDRPVAELVVPEPQADIQRGLALASCDCGGGPGCSSLYVDVVRLPWQVRWERFHDHHGWIVEDLGPFAFAPDQYDAALAALERHLSDLPLID